MLGSGLLSRLWMRARVACRAMVSTSPVLIDVGLVQDETEGDARLAGVLASLLRDLLMESSTLDARTLPPGLTLRQIGMRPPAGAAELGFGHRFPFRAAEICLFGEPVARAFIGPPSVGIPGIQIPHFVDHHKGIDDGDIKLAISAIAFTPEEEWPWRTLASRID